jgi:SAM-dependent methyltransferase
VIVPLILQLVSPQNIIDVGCGNGKWLSAFQESEIDDYIGVDGEWADREKLLIPAEKFMAANLQQPLSINRQFDLAISLEVAEHLSPASAETFIDSLTALSPVICFSAAIPFQGGYKHINERWPEYWADLFAQRGYIVVDALRSQIWHNPSVYFWYKQNILFFVQEDQIQQYPALLKSVDTTRPDQLTRIHPALYLRNAHEAVNPDLRNLTTMKIIAGLRAKFMHAIQWRVQRWRKARRNQLTE